MFARAYRIILGLAALSLCLPPAPASAQSVSLSVVTLFQPPFIGSFCAPKNARITLTVVNTGTLTSPLLPAPNGIAISGDAAGNAALPPIGAGGNVQVTVALTLQPRLLQDGTAAPVTLDLGVQLDLENRTAPTSPTARIQAVATECPIGTPSPAPSPKAGTSAPGTGVRVGSLRPATFSAVAAPRHLHRTADVGECQAHNGNFFCAALKGGAANFMVIVWDGHATADSYHVYRTDGGRKISVATPSQKWNGVIPTAQGLQDVQPGSCFSVSELRQGWESDLSAPFCVGNTVPSHEKVVTP